jgi:predicted alpha/beta hydrolase
MLGVWHAIPPITAAAGRLPMRRLRQGVDVPARAANQWAEWGRDPRYIGKAAEALPDAAFHTLDVPVRALAIADDTFAPPASIPPLLALYARASTEIVALEPRDYELTGLGHFGAFKRPALWGPWTQFLRGPVVAG